MEGHSEALFHQNVLTDYVHDFSTAVGTIAPSDGHELSNATNVSIYDFRCCRISPPPGVQIAEHQWNDSSITPQSTASEDAFRTWFVEQGYDETNTASGIQNLSNCPPLE